MGLLTSDLQASSIASIDSFPSRPTPIRSNLQRDAGHHIRSESELNSALLVSAPRDDDLPSELSNQPSRRSSAILMSANPDQENRDSNMPMQSDAPSRAQSPTSTNEHIQASRTETDDKWNNWVIDGITNIPSIPSVSYTGGQTWPELLINGKLQEVTGKLLKSESLQAKGRERYERGVEQHRLGKESNRR